MVWVNFLPWRQQRQRRQLRRDALLMLLLLALFSASTAPLLEQQASGERQRLDVAWLQEANGQLDRLKSRQARLEQQRDTLRQTLALSEERQERLHAWYAFAQGLAETMPAMLWLSDLSKTPESLNVAGFCQQLAEVETFRQRLQQNALFQQVKTNRLSRDGQNIIRFSLRAALVSSGQGHE